MQVINFKLKLICISGFVVLIIINKLIKNIRSLVTFDEFIMAQNENDWLLKLINNT
jgi:hypothetical protein